MMRKRFLILAAMAAFLAAGGMAWAQAGGAPMTPAVPGEAPMVTGVPMASGACCNNGVATVPSGQQCLLLHQVEAGENLHILAAYYYGDARAWRRIYELNKKTIRNPNRVQAGQVIKIEIPPCWTPRFDMQEFLRLEKRREALMKRAPGEKPMEYRSHEVLQPSVQVIIEEGTEAGGTAGGGPAKPPPTIIPGVGPMPQVPAVTPPPAPSGGEESAPPAGGEGGGGEGGGGEGGGGGE
jgi:uncharacterized membrane protein YgcG